MPTHLLLMRHAKSSWTDAAATDHARTLSKRGRKEADVIAQTLCAKGVAPDVIWASDAGRTQETAERLIRISPGAQTIVKVPEFYHASAASVLENCSRVQPPEGRLMLLGHNPGWSELSEYFTGRPISMPTACCLVFQNTKAAVSPWIAAENWRLIERLSAKDLLSGADDLS